jgi:hypothetical protein
MFFVLADYEKICVCCCLLPTDFASRESYGRLGAGLFLYGLIFIVAHLQRLFRSEQRSCMTSRPVSHDTEEDRADH